ncbi:hypothetical protein SAMN02990966_06934 [Rhodospirillales bacterium URHD0017]|nr:hypothetical protein SAMN02990966_06934 [Rhodospirillales bacterium URHD0017]
MKIDVDRWRRLLAAAADAEHDGPSFQTLQQANDDRARARVELARFRAAGPRGRASGPPMTPARRDAEILPGVDTIQTIDSVFATSVRELEARVAEAERVADRLAHRMKDCSERRTLLATLIDEVRAFAQRENIVLPDGGAHFSPSPGMPGPTSVRVPGPPPGSRSFWGRLAS